MGVLDKKVSVWHIIYIVLICTIFCLVVILILPGRICEEAYTNFSFAATITSIVLAVVSIVYSLQSGLSSVGQLNSIKDVEVSIKNELQKFSDIEGAINFVKEKNYDFIIIDCPPSLSLLTVNALVAADTVLGPLQCEYYALEGLNQVMKTIQLVKKGLNPKLEMEGVVFTMFDSRTNLSSEVVESVRENLNENIYNTMIHRNVRLAEAPSYGMPITVYDTRSAGAEDYRMLAAEVIKRGEEL